MENTQKNIRIDKWLWAARFYKTRQLAVKAIKNSQITSQGIRLKPASSVHIDDNLKIKRGIYEMDITVLSLSEHRGSATIAQTLYQETEQSQQRREHLKKDLAGQPKIISDRGKPDKRGVRTNLKLKRGE